MDGYDEYLYKSCMDKTSSTTAIQTYNLFGESDELPDVVHCESIAARSTLHNWEFAPHRHARLHQVLLIQQGGGEARIEGRATALLPSQLINVPVGCVHGFMFVKKTEGLVVTLADALLDEILKETEGLGSRLQTPRIMASNTDIEGTFHSIAQEHARLSFARAHILRSLSGLLIGQLARVVSETEPGSANAPERQLRQRFDMLVGQHYLDHWRVADYARELAVTPGHLSRVMRRATGFSARHGIESRVIREARRHLAYSNLTVSEIAYALGFSDPAYFSRVFSRATGASPRVFRDRLADPG